MGRCKLPAPPGRKAASFFALCIFALRDAAQKRADERIPGTLDNGRCGKVYIIEVSLSVQKTLLSQCEIFNIYSGKPGLRCKQLSCSGEWPLDLKFVLDQRYIVCQRNQSHYITCDYSWVGHFPNQPSEWAEGWLSVTFHHAEVCLTSEQLPFSLHPDTLTGAN